MKNIAKSALLPAGMSDVLPPDAAFEAETLDRLMSFFSNFGYDKVKPPLIEFEDRLLDGLGEAMQEETFRLMDPISQRMMGVRADMTPQVARVAATRLRNSPRPLRLSYAGQVLRVKGSKLRPERQFSQAGAELIGVNDPLADTEIIVMAANALTHVGVTNLSIDLGIPTLVSSICKDIGISASTEERLRPILDRKDVTGIASLNKELGDAAVELFSTISAAAGPSSKSLPFLKTLELGKTARTELSALINVASLIERTAPELKLSIDPIENRGFEYHSGVTFTFFAHDVRGELGAGGRYFIENGVINGEPSTGFTLFMDTVSQALPRRKPQPKLFIPFNAKVNVSKEFHPNGWTTIAGLSRTEDNIKEAQRLRCTHVFTNGKIIEL